MVDTRPTVPLTLDETGLDTGVLIQLVLKMLYFASNFSEAAITERIGLPLSVTEDLMGFLTREKLCEATGGRTGTLGGAKYTLTTRGLERASVALSVSGYIGRAPVRLEEYASQVRKQSVYNVTFSRDDIEASLSHLVLPQETRTLIGQALSSKKTTLIHGASGNGKTSVALGLKQAIPGEILIPYAVEFMGEIIQVFDPTAHEAVETAHNERDESGTPFDQRWLVIRRPTVFVAGELAANQLELVLDEVHKVYDAPVQMKSNGGLLIIDDFGRQQDEARYLLNRWVTPLERQIDYLSLHSGARLEVPFDTIPLFVSNRPPTELADEAFLRRIRYKVEIPSPDEGRFVEILRRECLAYGVEYDDSGATHLVNQYYRNGIREMRGCHPRDIVEAISDAARYESGQPTLSSHAIDQACRHYFV